MVIIIKVCGLYQLPLTPLLLRVQASKSGELTVKFSQDWHPLHPMAHGLESLSPRRGASLTPQAPFRCLPSAGERDRREEKDFDAAGPEIQHSQRVNTGYEPLCDALCPLPLPRGWR